MIAAAITTIMAAFGSAIGLSMVSADTSRSSGLTALAIAAGLWALWVTISACAAGAIWLGAHGLVVWAAGAPLVAMLTSSALTGAAKTAATGVAAAATGAGALISRQVNPLGSHWLP